MKSEPKKYQTLCQILESMDIPETRKEDYHWLLRNLLVRNGTHPRVKEALDLICDLASIRYS